MVGSEDSTAIVIHTATYRIEGRIALVPGARLTDFVRSTPEFIAIADAVVYDHAGKKLFSSEFIDVAKRTIDIIAPADAIRKG
jgi:hypothetical protein